MNRDKKDYEQKSKKWADAIGNITIKLSLADVLEDDDCRESKATDDESASKNFSEQKNSLHP